MRAGREGGCLPPALRSAPSPRALQVARGAAPAHQLGARKTGPSAPLPSAAVQQPPRVPAETATSSGQEPSAWRPSPGSPRRLPGAVAGPMGPLPDLRG